MRKKPRTLKLLPIMSSMFNMREMTKQMILLEMHLSNRRQRCCDCIRKHFLTVEALAEEAMSLNGAKAHMERLCEIADTVRGYEEEFEKQRNFSEMAQKIRALRKPLMSRVFTVSSVRERKHRRKTQKT